MYPLLTSMATNVTYSLGLFPYLPSEWDPTMHAWWRGWRLEWYRGAIPCMSASWTVTRIHRGFVRIPPCCHVLSIPRRRFFSACHCIMMRDQTSRWKQNIKIEYTGKITLPLLQQNASKHEKNRVGKLTLLGFGTDKNRCWLFLIIHTCLSNSKNTFT